MDDASRPSRTQEIPATPTQDADLTGQSLGEFRILRRLGQGGMGQVYLAEQISLKRKVALKILRPDLAAAPVTLARFKVEAENVARATHANIVQIYAIGAADGHHYMALEYVEGKNLREYLEKKGPVDAALGLRIMAQVAAALQRAGELGLIHRDVKPENILLTRLGEVKVADFGLSRCFAETGQPLHLTQSGVTMGTPLYMSPEQVEGKPIDPRTDIYSFGVTCYHMFAGHPPFRGQTPFEVAVQHVQREPEPLTATRPDLPAELCAAIHKMMAKQPDARYQTGREVLREVARLREQLVTSTPAPAPSFDLTTLSGLTGDAGSTVSTQVMPVRPRWRLGIILGVLAVLLALAGGLAFGWSRYQPDVEPNPPPPLVGVEPPLPPNQEREKELRRLVTEHLKPESRLDALAGLKHSAELGRLLLKERRLDEATKFFDTLDRPAMGASYRLLGRIGAAATLAFRDEPAASNRRFLAIVTEMERFDRLLSPGVVKRPAVLRKELQGQKDQVEAYQLLWKDSPQVRELVARALTCNRANDPKQFPTRLERYLHPPRPTLKSN